MWELDHKEGWALKNWCFWIVVLEKTLENPLDSKEIKPVNPKGNQSWLFIGRTEAKVPKLWPLDAKSWLVGKDPDAGRESGAGREGDDRGWDGWMASLSWCTWVWMNSRSWWWTGRPGVLRFMGSQTVGHTWVTEMNWTELRPLSLVYRWLLFCCILTFCLLCACILLVSLPSLIETSVLISPLKS